MVLLLINTHLAQSGLNWNKLELRPHTMSTAARTLVHVCEHSGLIVCHEGDSLLVNAVLFPRSAEVSPRDVFHVFQLNLCVNWP